MVRHHHLHLNKTCLKKILVFYLCVIKQHHKEEEEAEEEEKQEEEQAEEKETSEQKKMKKIMMMMMMTKGKKDQMNPTYFIHKAQFKSSCTLTALQILCHKLICIQA